MEITSLYLAGVRINVMNNSDLIEYIERIVTGSENSIIGYANASVINSVYKRPGNFETLNRLDIVHPDGIGVHWALKYVYPGRMNFERMTGSDFYPLLAQKAIEQNWSVFFFGHDENTLSKIKLNFPNLKIAGTRDGYDFEDKDVIDKINSSGAQILVIGLGFPLQEEWILKNKHSLKNPVSILVGDGIKVFAGIKRRGPVFMRNIGLEWLVRLMSNPFRYWKRYVIGNPLFLYRMFRYKMGKLKKN